MTPERLAEIERWADSPLLAELKVSKAEEGWIQGGKNTAKVLIAHIRDLEAQVREAREALGRIAFEDEVVYLGCADLPFCQRTHHEHCPVRIARDALAAATPPSPEVGA